MNFSYPRLKVTTVVGQPVSFIPWRTQRDWTHQADTYLYLGTSWFAKSSTCLSFLTTQVNILITQVIPRIVEIGAGLSCLFWCPFLEGFNDFGHIKMHSCGHEVTTVKRGPRWMSWASGNYPMPCSEVHDLPSPKTDNVVHNEFYTHTHYNRRFRVNIIAFYLLFLTILD